jgi:SCP-2 sterol transfer family
VARFLSQEWFDELPAAGDEHDAPDLIVEIAVSGAPEGDVRYQVVVRGERAGVVAHEDAFLPPHAEMKSDYSTMAGIASGQLSALDALCAGQARVSGDIGALSSKQSTLAGLDLVPPSARATTTF